MARTDPTFLDMFRALPGRTLVLSAVPLLVAGLLAANVVRHDLPALHAAAVGLVFLGCAAVVTRQHLASFRTRTLEEDYLN